MTITVLSLSARPMPCEFLFRCPHPDWKWFPRLFFSDIKLKDKNAGESYFIIETKNSLEEKNEKVESRPRTYKVIRPGLEFEGNIKFKGSSEYESEMKKELEQMLLKFNDGIYGIGNSKSRGYGNIEVELCGEKNDVEI